MRPHVDELDKSVVSRPENHADVGLVDTRTRAPCG